jgi:ribose transport system ATP-binding protein
MLKLLEMKNITKSFPGVKALDDVYFDIDKGEVHAIAGENGAGKSTFMKILTGIYKADQGEIIYKGVPFEPINPKYTQDMGISIIHQELNLMPELTVAENMFIAREPRRMYGLIDDSRMVEESKKILSEIGLQIKPNVKVKNLSIAERQMVEIAKALVVKSDILILDEPTSALSIAETERLFGIIRKLRADGVGIIYISHRLEEFDAIIDRVTVLRDGKYISTHVWSEFSIPQLIHEMVGRDMNEEYPKRDTKIGDVALEVSNLTRKVNRTTILNDVSFSVRKGEVLGFAGLVGAGRTELARAIIGADPITTGDIYINGEKKEIRNPSSAITNGIAYLPEDRKDTGLFLDQSVVFNVTIASLENISKKSIINDRKGKENTQEKVDLLHIKTPSISQIVQYLSGGNQQKVLIARWLCRNFDVVIFDEPTRGIDVGAKYEVYTLINQIASRGAAVVVISSEMNELIGMSDRIVVMAEGKITGELDRNDATQNRILTLASNLTYAAEKGE